jgi:predicted DNA-binding transcriptional regulator YafY/adenylate kinase family enzyme
MKKIAIINRGIPATGKTTFAKKIKNTLAKYNLTTTICSTNDFFMRDGAFKFDLEKLGENHKKNQKKFQKALDDGVDVVICDNINTEPWEANTYYHMAKLKNYKVILIDFEPNTLEWHIAIQNHPSYNKKIPQDVLKDFYKRYKEFNQLIDKYSHPLRRFKKKIYDEQRRKTQKTNDPSEPFFYDYLIKVSVKEKKEIEAIIGQTILNKMRDFTLEELKLIPKEYKIIIEEFYNRRDNTITAYDIKERIGKSIKQIERYIEDLSNEFRNIIPTKVGRKKGYKLLLDYDDIIIEAIQDNSDLYDLFDMLKSSNSNLLNKLGVINFSKENTPLLFKNSLFEELNNKDIFKELKQAIKKRKYKTIVINKKKLEDIKPIKLIFVDNNWYLAYEYKNTLKLSRIAFIEKVKHSYKNSFQESSIKRYLEFLKDETKFQNSMTIYAKEKNIATIKALPRVAKYFEENMKKFLPSQKFLRKEKDGSILFTLEYTQPLEILPFIQKWLPDLVILEPKSLQEEYKRKLQQAIFNIDLSTT